MDTRRNTGMKLTILARHTTFAAIAIGLMSMAHAQT
jgi:hypothetical protein